MSVLRGRECVCWGWSGEIACVGGGGGVEGERVCVLGGWSGEIACVGRGSECVGGEGAAKSPDPPVYPL